MRQPLLVLAIGLTTQFSTAHAHSGDRIYPIYELPTADLPSLQDGTLADWDAVLPGTSLDHNAFQVEGGRVGGIEVDDLAWRVFLGWHHRTQKLLFAVERIDDDYTGSEGGIHLFVDGDHSGGKFNFLPDELTSEEYDRQNGSQAQYFYLIPRPPGGDRQLNVQMSTAALWAPREPWVDAGGFRDGAVPDRSVVEASLTIWDDLDPESPELSKQSLLEPGKIIGLNIWMWDRDTDSGDGVTESYVLVKPRQFSGLWADDFVDGELVPCAVLDCSQATTAVTLSSWARIKASFAQE